MSVSTIKRWCIVAALTIPLAAIAALSIVVKDTADTGAAGPIARSNGRLNCAGLPANVFPPETEATYPPDSVQFDDEKAPPVEEALVRLYQAIDTEDTDAAWQATDAVTQALALEREAGYVVVVSLLRHELERVDSKYSVRVKRAAYLYLACPCELRRNLLQDTLVDWKRPLEGITKTKWWSVNEGQELDVLAREALVGENERCLARALVYAFRQSMSRSDEARAEMITDFAEHLDEMAGSFVLDPVLSWILFDVNAFSNGGAIQIEHFEQLLERLKHIESDERFSHRLRLQVRKMLRSRTSLTQSEILRQLGAVESWSEASQLVTAYLNEDPHLKSGFEEPLRILLEKLNGGDAHWALVTAYSRVNWLHDARGAQALASAIASAELEDTDDALFVRIMGISEVAREARPEVGGGYGPLFFPPGTGDAETTIRGWIKRLPGKDFRWSARAMLIGALGKIIVDTHLSTEVKYKLLEEMIGAAGEVHTLAQRDILWRLRKMPVDELLANRDATLQIWEDVVTAPFQYSRYPGVADTQRLEGFTIWEHTEYLLTLLGFPSISQKAQRALLDRYTDAKSLGREYDPDGKKNTLLDTQYEIMSEAGCFE